MAARARDVNMSFGYLIGGISPDVRTVSVPESQTGARTAAFRQEKPDSARTQQQARLLFYGRRRDLVG